MKGLCILFFFCIIVVSMGVPTVHAQLPEISTGLGYLASAQNADGTWSIDSSMVETTAATVTVLDSLKLLNQSTGGQYSAGISWLQEQSPQSVAYTADRIRILNLGAGSVDFLMNAREALKGAWGGGEGYDTDILHPLLYKP